VGGIQGEQALGRAREHPLRAGKGNPDLQNGAPHQGYYTKITYVCTESRLIRDATFRSDERENCRRKSLTENRSLYSLRAY
jgi:hypothetical protein